MILPQFQYVSPKTTDELTTFLSQYRKKAKILCGGTDLLVAMKDKQIKPEYIIDISGLNSLQGITYENGKGLVIGAATKLKDIEQAPVIKEKYYALHQGAAAVGSPQVRAMGTIGGNSCTASPAADTPPSLIVFGARINLMSQRGRRQILLEEFLLDNRVTALEEDEFLESFVLEEPWRNSASCYLDMGLRQAMEIDMVNLAVNLALDPGSRKVKDVRIVMGAVAPTPLRARQTEALLKGHILDEALFNKAAEICASESRPIDDFRAMATYRKEIVKVLCRRALKQVLSTIG
jgi:carbon-monoxide dehydrogenase medium subunit